MCITSSNSNTVISLDQRKTSLSSSKNKRRRLTFAPESQMVQVVGEVLAIDAFTDEEIQNSWWTANEHQQNRSRAVRIVHRVRERGQHLVALIDESFKTAQKLALRLEDKQIEELVQDPSEYTSKLEAWTLNGQGRRGLERHMSPFQKSVRIVLKREVAGMVLEMARSGIADEEIAAVYAEQAAESRIYARMMGDADYCAAYFERLCTLHEGGEGGIPL